MVVISKTFTTAETMLNARTTRKWLVDTIDAPEKDVVSHHMVAVSCNTPRCVEFGISHDRIFGFWDWVGGRYSVCCRTCTAVAPWCLPVTDHRRQF